MQHTVVAVCRGNICRSPVVERVLPSLLDSSVVVTSAGTQAAVGYPIDPPMAELLDRDGYPTGGFAARQLDAATVARATVLLTMTTEQRADVVALVPSAAPRTFTLVELAHLLRAAPPLSAGLENDGARWATIPAAVASARAHLRTRSLDIADPFRQSPQRYAQTYAAILDALSVITRATRAIAAPHWDPWQARSAARAAQGRQPRQGRPSVPRHARP